jgi:hypothetical protein
MFLHRGISMIDVYLCGVAEPIFKIHKFGWKKFIYFLVEENYNNSDREDKNLCQIIYLKFLNWAFVKKEVIPTSLNIVSNTIVMNIFLFVLEFEFI